MTITTGYRSWSDERKERMQLLALDVLGVAATIMAIAIVIGVLIHGCMGSLLTTTKKDRKPEPIYTAHVHYYSRPAAFRLSTPTPEQMDHLHAMLVVEQVRRPDRIDTDVN